MKEKLELIENSFDKDIAEVSSSKELEDIRLKYLGKKGLINDVMADFRLVPNDQKREMGALVNAIKTKIEESINQAKEDMDAYGHAVSFYSILKEMIEWNPDKNVILAGIDCYASREEEEADK